MIKRTKQFNVTIATNRTLNTLKTQVKNAQYDEQSQHVNQNRSGANLTPSVRYLGII